MTRAQAVSGRVEPPPALTSACMGRLSSVHQEAAPALTCTVRIVSVAANRACTTTPSLKRSRSATGPYACSGTPTTQRNSAQPACTLHTRRRTQSCVGAHLQPRPFLGLPHGLRLQALRLLLRTGEPNVRPAGQANTPGRPMHTRRTCHAVAWRVLWRWAGTHPAPRLTSGVTGSFRRRQTSTQAGCGSRTLRRASCALNMPARSSGVSS